MFKEKLNDLVVPGNFKFRKKNDKITKEKERQYQSNFELAAKLRDKEKKIKKT